MNKAIVIGLFLLPMLYIHANATPIFYDFTGVMTRGPLEELTEMEFYGFICYDYNPDTFNPTPGNYTSGNGVFCEMNVGELSMETGYDSYLILRPMTEGIELTIVNNRPTAAIGGMDNFTLTFRDLDGDALSDISLPVDLNLDRFDVGSLVFEYPGYPSDPLFGWFEGEITSITRAAVPEPAISALLLASFLAMAIRRKEKKE